MQWSPVLPGWRQEAPTSLLSTQYLWGGASALSIPPTPCPPIASLISGLIPGPPEKRAVVPTAFAVLTPLKGQPGPRGHR